MTKNFGKGVGNLGLVDKTTPMQEFVVKLIVDETDTCCLYLKSGKVFLDDTVFSGCYISQSNPVTIPLLVLSEGSDTIMNRCQLVGNKNYCTTGILAKYCDLIIK